MYSHTYSDDFWRENDMNDILIGSDKFLTTGNSMMGGSPGGLDLNVSQNMFEANNNTHISQTPVNKMTAQNMTTEGAYISPLNPFSKSMNVHSDNQQPLTVTTSTTNIGPIMSQAPPGVGFNPITQITGNDDENRLAGNRQLHAQGSEGDGTKGVCKVLDVGADDGHTMLKVSSQPHCENRRYGSPGVLHREKQQDMGPGYGYQFYGSADGPRLKDRYYGSPSVPQLGNQYYRSTYRPRYEIQHGRSHTIQMYGDQHYDGSDVPRWGNQHHGGPECRSQEINSMESQECHMLIISSMEAQGGHSCSLISLMEVLAGRTTSLILSYVPKSMGGQTRRKQHILLSVFRVQLENCCVICRVICDTVMGSCHKIYLQGLDRRVGQTYLGHS